MKEACILERLRGHPNVVHLKGVCVNPRHYALVLEFVDNGNLEDLLLHKKNDQPQVQRWYRRCQMGLDVARGMQFLHSQEPSIIHRDLKSSNVLVTKKYRCKVRIFSELVALLASACCACHIVLIKLIPGGHRISCCLDCWGVFLEEVEIECIARNQ